MSKQSNEISKQMSKQLAKCPFCGGEAIKSAFSWWNISDEFTIECTVCDARTTVLKSEEAIKAWNNRKPLERVIERLEEQAEECKKYWDEFDDEDAFGGMNAYMNSIAIIIKQEMM